MDYLKDGFVRFDMRNECKMNLAQKKNVQRRLDFVVDFVVIYILAMRLQEEVVSETLDSEEGSSDYNMVCAKYSLLTTKKLRLRCYFSRADFKERRNDGKN